MAVILSEYGKLSVIFHNLVTVQNFLNDLVIWPRMLEEGIVHFASSCWIDSDEESSSLILQDGLLQIFFVFEVCGFLERLKQWRIFDWVF